MGRLTITPEAYRQAVTLRDLTDERAGAHAMQLLIGEILDALGTAWDCDQLIHRCHPVVTVAENYDRLHYHPQGASRDARYSRYVATDLLLRTQTSAAIPGVLRVLAAAKPQELLIAVPGLVYRRDCIDRLHTGEPHQLDLWRLRRGRPLGRRDLRAMVQRVTAAAVPTRACRSIPAKHPYTVDGLQIDIRDQDHWVEVGECGRALPALLAESGLNPRDYSGLAMGLGLDRLLMLRKGIVDIRLLRSDDPRVAAQMRTLEPYEPVSSMPPIRRDLSIAVTASLTPEEIGDQVREALGSDAELIESVQVLSETDEQALPPAARQRLGMRPGQKNVLVRVVLRALLRTLTTAEANRLQTRMLQALHQGSSTDRDVFG